MVLCGIMTIACSMETLIACHRDHGYVEPSDLNVECVHHQPNSSHSLPYLTQCYYEAFVRRRVAEYLGLQQLLFLPPRSPTWALTAPTWNDTVYRHQVMQVCRPYAHLILERMQHMYL